MAEYQEDPYMQAILDAIEPAATAVGLLAPAIQMTPRGSLAQLRGRHPSGSRLTLRIERTGLDRTVSATLSELKLIGGMRLSVIGRHQAPCQYVTTAPPVGLVEAILDWLAGLTPQRQEGAS